MDAVTFNARFDQIVAPAFIDRGGYQQGRRLFVEIESWTVALLRTNLRNVPPPRFNACVRPRGSRDFNGEVPQQPPTAPSEYPIKMRPSELTQLLMPQWRYRPFNLGTVPGDEIGDALGEQAAVALWEIRRIFDELLDELQTVLAGTRLLCELERHGEDAWCERRWIEDLRALHPDHICEGN